MIGAGISPLKAALRNQAVSSEPTPEDGPALISFGQAGNGFFEDKAVFDSDAANGNNAATVNVRVTTSTADSAPIYLRVVNLSGVPLGSWTQVATNDTTGERTVSLTGVPRTSGYAKLQTAYGAGQIAETLFSFASGHKIALWEQSNWARWFGFDWNIPLDTVAQPDHLQIYVVDRSTQAVTRHLVNDGNAGTTNPFVVNPGTVAMANVLAAERPGEVFAFTAHTEPGTSPEWLMDDLDTRRMWDDEVALDAGAKLDGQTTGLVMTCWYAWANAGPTHFERYMPILLQRDQSGNRLAISDVISGTWGSYTLNYSLDLLYDYLNSNTRVAWIGPQSRPGSTQTGYNEVADIDYRTMTDSWVAASGDDANFPELLDYVTATTGAIRDDVDTGHFDMDIIEGTKLHAERVMAVMLRTMGLTSWTVPAFDNIEWTDGVGAVAWFSGGDITTLRELTRAGTTTELVNFTLGGPQSPLAGVVWALDAGGSGRRGVFLPSATTDFSTVFNHGEGRNPGIQNMPADLTNEVQLDLPVVPVGNAQVPIMVEPRTLKDLPNPYPVPPFFTTSSVGAGPWYELNNVSVEGQNTGQITFAVKGKIVASPPDNAALVCISAAHMDIHRLRLTGIPRVTMKDSSGATILSSYQFSSLSIPEDVNATTIVSVDLVAQTLDIWVDGANEQAALAANTGLFASNRQVLMLARNNSGGYPWAGDCDYVKIWYNTHTATGVEPAAAPDVYLTGPAAVANAFRGKLGADAT